MALEMGVIIFLGVFGGLKLDQKLNLSFPFFTLLLSIVSVSLAIYVAIKDFLK
ncbi:MAG: AtpZ/AtpI family protein [Bacteroidales bacterium]|nr:AtpZ/AtpI family protein [Bacteroidales bacterium]